MKVSGFCKQEIFKSYISFLLQKSKVGQKGGLVEINSIEMSYLAAVKKHKSQC